MLSLFAVLVMSSISMMVYGGPVHHQKFQRPPYVFQLPLSCMSKSLELESTNREPDYSISCSVNSSSQPKLGQYGGYYWSGGVVPYYITPGAFDQCQTDLILEGMRQIKTLMASCVSFRPWIFGDASYIEIGSEKSGCWANVGPMGTQSSPTATTVNLGKKGKDKYACFFNWERTSLSVQTVVHELMHAVGTFHEQSRCDRDKYIEIVWQNIDGSVSDFDIPKQQQVGTYDYGSIMQYPGNANSKDGSPTMIAINPQGAKVGWGEELSNADIQKLGTIYNCPGTRRVAVKNC